MTKTKKKKRSGKTITSEHLALRELRLECEMTLKEAGEKYGLSSKGMGAIENGRVSLNREKIEAIINSYGLTYLDFVRAKRLIEKGTKRRPKRVFVKTVLKNSDRRSYQKLITKECKVLRCLRRIKKISQDQASAMCGYSRPTIGHIENGRIELSEERIRHIVKSYGYKFSDFKDAMEKAELRDTIMDSCLEKIDQLDDTKLEIVKNLLGSF